MKICGACATDDWHTGIKQEKQKNKKKKCKNERCRRLVCSNLVTKYFHLVIIITRMICWFDTLTSLSPTTTTPSKPFSSLSDFSLALSLLNKHSIKATRTQYASSIAVRAASAVLVLTALAIGWERTWQIGIDRGERDKWREGEERRRCQGKD